VSHHWTFSMTAFAMGSMSQDDVPAVTSLWSVPILDQANLAQDVLGLLDCHRPPVQSQLVAGQCWSVGMTALPQLDIAMDTQAQLRSPPTSPARSFYQSEMFTSPVAAVERFKDWEPELRIDTDAEVEAQLLASPLSNRLGLSPKGQMVVGLEDAVPEEEENEEDEAETIDVSKLEEEYRMYKQEALDRDLQEA